VYERNGQKYACRKTQKISNILIPPIGEFIDNKNADGHHRTSRATGENHPEKIIH
jgi:hypothetical protein